MLQTQDNNDVLVHTGPETAMGNLFRRYWLPALLAEELPENDGAPVRVQLLSEKLVAFRDSQGRLGLVQEACPHRRASLWYGRNEEGGLRCPYHGWKFDVGGKCLEIPSEPEDSPAKKRAQLRAYPLVRRGPVLWTYMGPPELQPALPEFEFATVPETQSYMSKRLQECNWLQALEGGIDSSHVSWLHRSNLESDPLFKGTEGNKYNMSDMRVGFDVLEHASGLFIGARRSAGPGRIYWRITPWVFPYFTMVPPRGDHPVHGHFWVPIDDEHCWAWSYDYHPTRALSETEVAAMRAGLGIHAKVDPKTFRPIANKDNDYLMERSRQTDGTSYSGVEGIAIQDASLQESMGPIVDRSQETLVATDLGIVMARRQLVRAARALADRGEPPPGTEPETHRVRSVSIVLPEDVPFVSGAKDALLAAPNKPHASV
jgi:nitrite reductase/ring-hydroxylating ferredoxin subunit